MSLARGILSGAVGFIEGARFIAKLGHALGFERDPDMAFLLGVDSETDHLPVGEVRRHWAADALRSKDLELRECELLFREQTFQSCLTLIQRYGNCLPDQDHSGEPGLGVALPIVTLSRPGH